jgi:hypothetical protein
MYGLHSGQSQNQNDGFCLYFCSIRRNSAEVINSGGLAISAGTDRRDLTAPLSDLAAGAGPGDILK